MSDAQPASVYDLSHAEEAENLATFAILVENEPGVLHRLVGLFAARGYNIESLTVAETDRRAHTSRVTIVTRGAPHVLEQIEAQLEKMVATRHVQDVTRDLQIATPQMDVHIDRDAAARSEPQPGRPRRLARAGPGPCLPAQCSAGGHHCPAAWRLGLGAPVLGGGSRLAVGRFSAQAATSTER